MPFKRDSESTLIAPGINRIVGAANMFDLLPESRAPKRRSPMRC
jgi:hypothetical protein